VQWSIFLLTQIGLTKSIRFSLENSISWYLLRSYFGENWADRLREMTVDEIEEVFKDNFYFEKYDVYGVE